MDNMDNNVNNHKNFVKTVTRLIATIINYAIEGRANEIHLEPLPELIKIRFRRDGLLFSSLALPQNFYPFIFSQIKKLAGLDSNLSFYPQQGVFCLNVYNREINFLVSTVPLIEGEKIVLRLLGLDFDFQSTALNELGFNQIQTQQIKKSLKKSGLILAAGPKDSGKTTTLYTLLLILKKNKKSIVTFEDPLKYSLSEIVQCQLSSYNDYDLYLAIYPIFRQDVEIIMLSQIKTPQIAQLAIEATNKGYLVLSTLPSPDTLTAIYYLLNLGISPAFLAFSLNLVISQRLIRKICPHCKIAITLPSEVEQKLKEEIKKIPLPYLKEIDLTLPLTFFRGEGCAYCGNLGYRGRLLVSEVLDVSKEIRETIKQGADLNKIKAILENQNFLTFREDALIKALGGYTTLEEIMKLT